MNVLQWDNVVLGNADLALGADRLKAAKKTANFPMLAENTVLQGSNWRKLLSFEIIEEGGFQIGGFGLMTPAAPMYHQKLDDYLAFLDIFGSAKEIIQILCEEQQVDLIIELLYSGSNKNSKTKKTCILASPTRTLRAR